VEKRAPLDRFEVRGDVELREKLLQFFLVNMQAQFIIIFGLADFRFQGFSLV